MCPVWTSVSSRIQRPLTWMSPLAENQGPAHPDHVKLRTVATQGHVQGGGRNLVTE